MKRFLLILLLLALPLQSTWAVAATYCQHQNEKTTKHFGHHEHQHDQAQQDDEGKKSRLSFHSDCMSCHGAAVGLTSVEAVMAADAAAVLTRSFDGRPMPSSVSYPPEKPNWVRAA